MRRCARLLHNRNDKAGNAFNFAFDTSSNIYRDAVKPKESVGPRSESVAAAAAPATSPPPTGKTQLRRQPPKPAASLRRPPTKEPKPDTIGSGSTTVRRFSGLQLEILQLYRSFMKTAGKKTDPASRECLQRYIRGEFNANKDIPRKFVTKIEWQLHYGRTRLEELKKTKPTDKFSIFM